MQKHRRALGGGEAIPKKEVTRLYWLIENRGTTSHSRHFSEDEDDWMCINRRPKISCYSKQAVHQPQAAIKKKVQSSLWNMSLPLMDTTRVTASMMYHTAVHAYKCTYLQDTHHSFNPQRLRSKHRPAWERGNDKRVQQNQKKVYSASFSRLSLFSYD